MSKLRKMKKAVNRYVILICEHQEDAKRNCKTYLEDVETLQTAINAYLDQTEKLFKIWCNTSVEVFNSDNSTFFLHLKRSLDMMIVNHYLNKFCYELTVSMILKKNIDIIHQRLVQYDYFC